jgi:hypothetical protein
MRQKHDAISGDSVSFKYCNSIYAINPCNAPIAKYSTWRQVSKIILHTLEKKVDKYISFTHILT